MKRCFLLSCITAVAIAATGQIEIIKNPEVKRVGQIRNRDGLIAEITYNIKETDTIYTLAFKTGRFDLAIVSFNGKDSTLWKFYNILKSVFLPENKKNKTYRVDFRLGETDVSVSRAKPFEGTSAYISTVEGSLYLLEPQVDKLFGKQ